MDTEGTIPMWSFKRLALLTLLLAGTFGIAVLQDWRVVEMVTGIGLLLALSVTVFRAVIDSLLLP
jgi:hypothetical protein